MSAFNPCVLIPTYNNPATLRGVVERARQDCPDIVVIDDHSADAGRLAPAAKTPLKVWLRSLGGKLRKKPEGKAAD